ncbi:MAG: HlyD family efflux transporter periplasmic adaptor subunit, partial [Planctomycetaceae bacterium]|nr:HlyD family efflux transporter periplasmic adaptor subunit [Planctomycetaceae bacterium]
GAIGMLTLMLMIPCPYWVACDCEVQPVHRRFLAAPFDSKLQESFVEPGDVVSQGQVLARLDERDVDWELAGIEAELQRLRKERDGHVAAAKYGEAEVARFEIERLAVRQDFYLARFEELEVRSPIDGIVIAGDLKKTEGAPLEQGQTLFEIAPLDEMTVEVRIPEKEISYVSEEMWVEARFDSWPGRKWSGSLNRLQPRGEVLDDQQVFRGEIPIDNGLAMLRPGMHGRAWIRSATRPLGWNLFHHAWEQTQIWMGW